MTLPGTPRPQQPGCSSRPAAWSPAACRCPWVEASPCCSAFLSLSWAAGLRMLRSPRTLAPTAARRSCGGRSRSSPRTWSLSPSRCELLRSSSPRSPACGGACSSPGRLVRYLLAFFPLLIFLLKSTANHRCCVRDGTVGYLPRTHS